MSARIIDFAAMARQLRNPENRIREWRERRGYTLEDVADMLEGDATPTMISRWERGERNVSIKRLRQLARVLRTDPGQLLSAEDNPMSLSEAERQVIETMRSGDQVGHTIARVAEGLQPWRPPSEEELRRA